MDLTHRWPYTLTLTERSRTLRENGHARYPANSAPVTAKLPRLDQWSSQPPFDDKLSFVQRLAADGLTEEIFERLLNETIAELEARFPEAPAWVSDFAQAWSSNASAENFSWPKPLTHHNLYGFLRALEPLLIHYCDQLRTGIQDLVAKYADLPFDPQTIEDSLLVPVPDQVFRMAGRTLILELHVARLRGQLPGDTPEARYQQFFEQLRDPEKLSALFKEYVVLAHQLTIYLTEWVDTNLEFLQRLCADWDAIQSTFTPNESPGKLVKLESGLGDRHGGGRTVGIAHFASGFRVVYKPRPQAITLHFQELLAWLNAHDLPQPFRTVKVLNRGRYGWMEFVTAHGCQSVEELTRFYERQGGYLALLYVLSGTDVHAENLIAAGEHPILIDVETLFHNTPIVPNMPDWVRPTQETLQSSVLRSLLLPMRLFADEEQDGIDMSGLGAAPGQLTPTPVPYWEGAGTDEVRLARKRVPLPGNLNRPTLGEQDIDVLDHLDTIVSGFETVYRLLIGHRAEFLSETGPLARFAADEARIILRATRTYAVLLNEGYHPNLLRDALARDRLFDYLWRQAAHHPELSGVIAFEKNDLHQGNIPLFSARPDSRGLWSNAGECVPDFFPETSMADVRRCVHELSEKDLETQSWLIRASFLSLPTATAKSALLAKSLTSSIAATPALSSSSSSAPKPKHQRLLDAAQAAGDRLEALALHHEDYVGWIEAKAGNEEFRGGITPLGLDLYGGLPGVAFFLAYLESITGEGRYRQLAEKTLFTMQSQLEETLSIATPIGAFTGWGGIVYLFTHLASLWHRPELLAATDRVVTRISELVEQDQALDVIAGAAGCIGSLLSLYHSSPSPRVIEVATQCGDHLIAQAKALEAGAGWLTGVFPTRPVTGFSHGTAGMAWALSALAEATGESRFQVTASSALAYERHAFSPETQNWRSLRDEDQAAQDDMLAWCYGAPGIGLARLNSYQADPQFEMEIETALQTTLARGFGRNQSLCHGDLGNLELLLQASQKMNSPYWKTQVDAIANSILDDISQRGWVGGTSLVTVPGLMTGIAGIGYELLRLAEPDKVPSVLTLAPPVIAAR